MIVCETDVGDAWPSDVDWSALAQGAVEAAVRASVFGTLLDARPAIEVSIKLADDAEVQALNRQYREKDKPTNVLSFPMVQRDLIETLANTDDGEALLGDIILAHGVAAGEAAAKGVDLATHATHLIVHGTFHLLGHDHVDDADGDDMEALERAALASLGIADPYAVDEA
jgi:probable rRNA maturation factor